MLIHSARIEQLIEELIRLLEQLEAHDIRNDEIDWLNSEESLAVADDVTVALVDAIDAIIAELLDLLGRDALNKLLSERNINHLVFPDLENQDGLILHLIVQRTYFLRYDI